VDPRKQRTMDALLAAAQQMFAERPVEEVTVEEIARSTTTLAARKVCTPRW
jgi:AcrR family transcriptional regulator